MRSLQLLTSALLIILLVASICQAAPKMRPYSGIGVLQLPATSSQETVPMYDDPGIERCCTLDYGAVKELNSWLFGPSEYRYLLVTSRKGDWLEVEHDDAGRTGWLIPQRSWKYSSWEQFLKGKSAVFLKNSPKKMMQIFPKAADEHGRPVSGRQAMKIIRAQGDWAYSLADHSTAGWIRWRDTDGRLLIGFDSTPAK